MGPAGGHLCRNMAVHAAAHVGRVGGGLMQIGKSKARVYVEADTKVSFDDVAGASARWPSSLP